jgi:hypothetical protein
MNIEELQTQISLGEDSASQFHADELPTRMCWPKRSLKTWKPESKAANRSWNRSMDVNAQI